MLSRFGLHDFIAGEIPGLLKLWGGFSSVFV